MGDYNFATAPMYRSSGLFSQTCKAWSDNKGWIDSWESCHPQLPGFTRAQDGSQSRLDYVFVVPSSVQAEAAVEAPPLVTSAWVGCEKEFLPGNLSSDHFPLLVEIHEQRWLASCIQTTDRSTRAMPDTVFPSDRWFIQNEAERREVTAVMAKTGQLPKKLEYSAWTQAVAGPAGKPALTALSEAAARARSNPTTQGIDEAVEAIDVVGHTASQTLKPERQMNGSQSCRRKGEPTYGREFAAYVKLKRWHRRVLRHGEAAFPRTAKRAGTLFAGSSLAKALPRMPGDDGTPPL